MKKYFQITFFLGIFSLLVLYRNLRGTDVSPAINTTTNTQTAMPTTTTQSQTSSTGTYKDGTYTGDVADAYYGNIQVQATINNGKITDVTFLQYPNDNRTSINVNEMAMPQLRQEAIQAQSAHVDAVSGASDTSAAFQQSLSSALQKAS